MPGLSSALCKSITLFHVFLLILVFQLFYTCIDLPIELFYPGCHHCAICQSTRSTWPLKAKKFQCKACHKFGHFTSLCYQKKQVNFKPRRPKAHQLQADTVYAKDSAICGQSEEDSSSEDFFCLQFKINCTQANFQWIPKTIHLITNLAYRLKPHHTRNLYLRARFDTCVDVNLMPATVYKLVFQDPSMKNLAPISLEIGIYTTDTVKIVGSCVFYLVHPDTKKLVKVTFFVAMKDGSILLFCMNALMSLKWLATSQDHLTIYRLIQVLHQGNTLLPNACSPQRSISTRIDKMLQERMLIQVHEATPWINSFVLVESKDILGNLKLHICFDPTNLNKAITREPYHFKTPEDIAHLLADACIMNACNCKKGYQHQKLDEALSFLATFNSEIGRFRYTVMPFV